MTSGTMFSVPLQDEALMEALSTDLAGCKTRGDTREFAMVHLRQSLLSKREFKNSAEQDQQALLKFLAVSERCKTWSRTSVTPEYHVMYGQLKSILYDFWYKGGYGLCDTFDQLFHYGRVGPGAAVMARGGDFYSKLFSSPMTVYDQGLYLAYKSYIRNFPEWSNAEIIRREAYGEAHVVAGSALRYVPKNRKISRCICVEANLNMFVQLGLGRMLEDRLREVFGINLSVQPDKNRELARLGSINETFATIDLSSASDSLSLSLLEDILPEPFYRLLVRLSAPKIDIPGMSYMEKGMIATMGNGFTFPLQTIIFSAIVVAVATIRGKKLFYPRGRETGNWAVFGDDIIVPTEMSEDVINLLSCLGFAVNDDKTFVKGPFRESCGHDYHLGVNVRPPFVKRLDCMQDHYSVVNTINDYSMRTGIELSALTTLLIKECEFNLVPWWENSDAGIKVPFSIHRALSPKVRVSRRYHGSLAYFAYRSVSDRFRVARPSLAKRRLIYNPSGVMMSVLNGSVRGGWVSVRNDSRLYRRIPAIAPNWDVACNEAAERSRHYWQRAERAVYLNLTN